MTGLLVHTLFSEFLDPWVVRPIAICISASAWVASTSCGACRLFLGKYQRAAEAEVADSMEGCWRCCREQRTERDSRDYPCRRQGTWGIIEGVCCGLAREIGGAWNPLVAMQVKWINCSLNVAYIGDLWCYEGKLNKARTLQQSGKGHRQNVYKKVGEW